jgi:D-tyrosyl-tRNA(Tyr) deacylase
MRAVVQRVTRARVSTADGIAGQIGRGLVVLVGVASGDDTADIEYIASKIRELRVFPDENGKMNRSLAEAGGQLLVVSQFTLMGDVRRGRRPAFDAAAPPDRARTTFEALLDRLRAGGPVETGVFQAHMNVELNNDGPVTVLLDSRRAF